ncbi:MAG: GAF domain-containing protein [Alphaproteobacteria bacterium]
MAQDTATMNNNGLRRSAIVETGLMIVALIVFDFLFLDKTRFWDTNPHPFWFVVLIVASKYGTREGLFAAIAASLGLLIGNMPVQGMEQDMYGYWFSVVKLPLLWLVGAMLFGELRQMHIRERDQLKRDLSSSMERESTISRSYQWVKELKERLELRMAGQLRSSISAYHAAKAMERLNPDEVLHGLEELVSNAINAEQFSVYTMTPQGLDLTLSHGWKEKDAYQSKLDTRNPLTVAIAGNSGVLCVANPDHEHVLSGQGILAGSLTDRNTGEVIGMLKVETLGFTDLNLSTIESFSAICEWASLALVNARKYQTAKSESMINPDHNMFTNNYFHRYLDFIAPLAKRVGFDVNMIVINVANASRLDEETRTRLGRLLSDAVNRVLRDIDLAFDYQAHSDDYSIVLPATSKRGAEIVLDRIRKDLLARSQGIANNATFSFSVQTVYEKA